MGKKLLFLLFFGVFIITETLSFNSVEIFNTFKNYFSSQPSYYEWYKYNLSYIRGKYLNLLKVLSKYKSSKHIDEIYTNLQKAYLSVLKIEDGKIQNIKLLEKIYLDIAYQKYKHNNFFKNILSQKKLESKKQQLYKKLWYTFSEVNYTGVRNDFELIKNNLTQYFSGINFLIWTGKKIITPSDHMIKISSLVGLRYLNSKQDYHWGIDITLSDLKRDIKFNCDILSNPKKRKKYLDYLVLSNFDKKYCNLYQDLPNFKKKYSIFIELTKDFWKNRKCYIGKNKSLLSKKDYLVWFGLFLLCWNNEDNTYFIIGHLKPDNYNILKQQNLITPIFDQKEKFRLWVLTSYFFEKNWYGFNDKTLTWDFPYQIFGYWFYNYRNEFYKLNIPKDIILEYGKSGYSFWEHIHFWILLKNGNIVSLLKDNNTYLQILKKLFNYPITLKDNFYFFFYNKY